MKKLFMLVAIAGLALAGCVKDEVQNLSNEQKGVKIAFEAPVLYDNFTTKSQLHGEITSTVYPKEENFVIFASQHTGDFTGWPAVGTANLPLNSTENGLCNFNGNTLGWNSVFDAWVPTYTEDGSTKYYYWPDGKKLSFSAMSPADLHSSSIGYTYGPSGLNITNFVNPEVGQQYDLLFAKRTTNKTAEDMLHSADYYAGIPISFQHALSSIHFSLDKESVDQNVRLKGITVTNVKNTANFSEKINESLGLGYAVGTNVNPEWTVETSSKVNYVSFDCKDGSALGLEFPVTPRYVTDIYNDLLAADKDKYSSNSLLVVPQEIGDDTKLVIEYTVDGAAKSKEYNLKGLATLNEAQGGIPGGIEETVNEWKIGHRYVYRLHYSASSHIKDVIYFSPSLEGWKLVQVINIEL